MGVSIVLQGTNDVSLLKSITEFTAVYMSSALPQDILECTLLDCGLLKS